MQLAVRPAELLELDHAFGLVADVDDDLFLEDAQDTPVDDLPLLDRMGLRLEVGENLGEVVHLLDVDSRPRRNGVVRFGVVGRGTPVGDLGPRGVGGIVLFLLGIHGTVGTSSSRFAVG